MNPIRLKKPPTAPAPITTFAPPKPPVAPTPIATGLPPPPVPMPVPDLAAKVPEGYDEIATMARRALQNRPEVALFWATMAQADATNQVAERLDEILQFFSPAEIETEGGEVEVPSEFSNVLSDGVRMAAHTLKDDVLALFPPEILGGIKAILQQRMYEALSQMRGEAKEPEAKNAPEIFPKKQH